MLLDLSRYYLQSPATDSLSPLDQYTGVAPISPNALQAREASQKSPQHQLGSVPVLYVGWVHRDGQQQALGIHHNMSLATSDLFPRIIAPESPFSVVLTDWLSMTAALGVGPRPLA